METINDRHSIDFSFSGIACLVFAGSAFAYGLFVAIYTWIIFLG